MNESFILQNENCCNLAGMDTSLFLTMCTIRMAVKREDSTLPGCYTVSVSKSIFSIKQATKVSKCCGGIYDCHLNPYSQYCFYCMSKL